jgi:WD40 repeat protein
MLFGPGLSSPRAAPGDEDEKVGPVRKEGKWEVTPLAHQTYAVKVHYFEKQHRLVIKEGAPQLWDTRTGKRIAFLPHQEFGIGSYAVSPDGTRLLTADDRRDPLTLEGEEKVVRSLWVWDLATGKRLKKVALELDAKLLGGRLPWTVHWLDADRGLLQLNGTESPRGDIAPAQSILVLLDLNTGKIIKKPAPLDPGRGILISPDRQKVLAGFMRERDWFIPREGSPPLDCRFTDLIDATTLKVIARLDPHDRPPDHPQDISHRVWSSDSRRIAIARWEGIISVWDAAKGKQLAILKGHARPILNLRFSADGQRLVTAGMDETARVWEVASGKEVCVLKGHTAEVYDAVFDPGHKFVLTCGKDETARLWELPAGKPLRVWPRHESAVSEARFVDGGKKILTRTEYGAERVWSVEDGSLVSEKNPLGPNVEDWRSPVCRWGNLFLNESTQEIWAGPPGVPRSHETDREWTRLPRLTLPGYDFQRTAIAPDGKHLATAAWKFPIRIWDTEKWDKATGAGRFDLPKAEEDVQSLAFAPDGKLLAAGYADGSVRLWNVATARLHAHFKNLDKERFPHTNPWHLAFSPDGTRLAFATEDNAIRVWDIIQGKELLGITGRMETFFASPSPGWENSGFRGPSPKGCEGRESGGRRGGPDLLGPCDG